MSRCDGAPWFFMIPDQNASYAHVSVRDHENVAWPGRAGDPWRHSRNSRTTRVTARRHAAGEPKLSPHPSGPGRQPWKGRLQGGAGGLEEQGQGGPGEADAVGRPLVVAALLVAADHAEHDAGAAVAVVVHDPGAAAGAVPVVVAVELHLARLELEAVRGALHRAVVG